MDPRFGDYVNHDFAEYHIATNADVGTIDVHGWMKRTRTQPDGRKGYWRDRDCRHRRRHRQRRLSRHRHPCPRSADHARQAPVGRSRPAHTAGNGANRRVDSVRQAFRMQAPACRAHCGSATVWVDRRVRTSKRVLDRGLARVAEPKPRANHAAQLKHSGRTNEVAATRAPLATRPLPSLDRGERLEDDAGHGLRLRDHDQVRTLDQIEIVGDRAVAKQRPAPRLDTECPVGGGGCVTSPPARRAHPARGTRHRIDHRLYQLGQRPHGGPRVERVRGGAWPPTPPRDTERGRCTTTRLPGAHGSPCCALPQLLARSRSISPWRPRPPCLAIPGASASRRGELVPVAAATLSVSAISDAAPSKSPVQARAMPNCER